MNVDDLRAKAAGICQSLAAIPAPNRSNQVNGLVAIDYNTLRAHVKNFAPDLEPVLPPEVRLHNLPHNQGSFARESYDDLSIFVEQLRQLLDLRARGAK